MLAVATAAPPSSVTHYDDAGQPLASWSRHRTVEMAEAGQGDPRGRNGATPDSYVHPLGAVSGPTGNEFVVALDQVMDAEGPVRAALELHCQAAIGV